MMVVLPSPSPSSSLAMWKNSNAHDKSGHHLPKPSVQNMPPGSPSAYSNRSFDDTTSSNKSSKPASFMQFESFVDDIQSISSSTPSATSYSKPASAEADWHEVSVRKQVASLDIDFQDRDLVQLDAPSNNGLRRRIIAASVNIDPTGSSQASFWRPRLAKRNALEKSGLFKAKFSFRKSSSKPTSPDLSIHSCDSMSSDNSTLTPSVETTSLDQKRSLTISRQYGQLEKELAEREKHFELEVLSRFEAVQLNMVVYTEQRQGNWVAKSPDERTAVEAVEELPKVYSPWDFKIDSRAIVERNKLRSYIELVDTTCHLRCRMCNSFRNRQHGFHSDPEECNHCKGVGLIKMTYVVCVTLRQSTFLPLQLPVIHIQGKDQSLVRKYIPRLNSARSHVDVLRLRAMDSIRSSAFRVGLAHSKTHEARLLFVKATLDRRSCNSVVILNRVSGVFRTFDVTDGGLVRNGRAAGYFEEKSRITETIKLSQILETMPIVVGRTDGLFRLVSPENVHLSKTPISVSVHQLNRPSEYKNRIKQHPIKTTRSPTTTTTTSSTDCFVSHWNESCSNSSASPTTTTTTSSPVVVSNRF